MLLVGFLESFGYNVSSIIAGFGIVCTVLSSAIYAFCEAWVDGKAVESDKQEET